MPDTVAAAPTVAALYTELVRKAYARRGNGWAEAELPGGSLLVLRIVTEPVWRKEVAVRRATFPATPDERKAFDGDVSAVLAVLEADRFSRWMVMRKGRTKSNGIAAIFGSHYVGEAPNSGGLH